MSNFCREKNKFFRQQSEFYNHQLFFYQNQKSSHTNPINLKSREGFVTLPNSKFKDGLQTHHYLLMPKWLTCCSFYLSSHAMKMRIVIY
ncbi:hypothetical protein [uncultured Gammaproteobacteria bacterium]|nr:hypothetical protein [uncultured Gammaproteobacteria bacterium]CAC9578313.1 hypothetical protein [uncultured Gammaproteobacteria bacterium]CAC9953714.1 hypothetical protein [uncultured Gammaproteobacteria bacterium]CAC9988181.1 hypothetical protein [uncultured Gammaproteobacteria bacterium]